MRKALHDGFDRIVAVGGDGTYLEAINGFFDGPDPINPQASFAILPLGTGSDLRRTLCVPKGEAAARLLISTRVAEIDLGRLTCAGRDGGSVTRYFLSSVHVGIGSVVSEHVNRRSKVLGGFLTFLLGVLTARLAYSCTPMTVTVDDETISDTLLDVIVANGRYDGGGMKMGPHAVLDDGLFDVYVIGNLGTWGTLLNVPRIYRGTHDRHPAVRYLRAKRVRIESDEPLFVSPDGEVPGIVPATIEILPKAVRIVAGEGAPIQGA